MQNNNLNSLSGLSKVLFVKTSTGPYFDGKEYKLKNGLSVICVKKKTLPIIACYIGYKCGARNDAVSKSGAAHYLEHMAFEMNDGAFQKFLESIGAAKNACTSLNFVIFHEIFAKEHLETILKCESDRMQSIDNISDRSFLSEKNAILEERSMAVDNNATQLNAELFLANLFNRDVISAVIGWKNEIENLTREDLIDYHQKWFAPNNAVVVLVGDIEPYEAKNLVEKYFGKIPMREIPKLNPETAKPDFFRECSFSSSKNGSGLSTSYVYYVPDTYRKDLKKFLSLQMAIKILNRSESFLRKTMQDIFRIGDVYLTAGILEFPFDIVDVSLDSSVNGCDKVAEFWEYAKFKFMKLGVSEEDLKEEKRQREISLAYENDDVDGMAFYITTQLVYGLSFDEIQAFDEVIQSITVEDCNEALREIFSSDPIAIQKTKPMGYDRDEE